MFLKGVLTGALAALAIASVQVPAADVAHPISIASPDLQDLAFLKTALKDARIVQLGENGHGAAEAMQARARIVRFLHTELGFTVLAFESSLFLCHLADARAAEMAPQRTLTSSVIGVWHTQEMLPLFATLRESREGTVPLRLAGFDVQPIGGNRKQRPGFLSGIVAKVDAEYAKDVLALDTEFFAAYDKGSAARREHLRGAGATLIARYDELAAFIEKHLSRLQKDSGREPPLVAAQEARSAAAYIRFQTAPNMREYAERRDHGMFENLRFLAERLFPDQKIIVWGHNYHLRHDNAAIPPTEDIFPGVAARTMGSWTREHFGRQVFTIGQYEFEGEMFDNSRKHYVVAPPRAGSLEDRLNQLSRGSASIVTLADTAAPPWASTVLASRYNGQQEQTLVPAKQYDALLFLPRVRPPAFLY
jgi:erythromycin esterase